MSPNDFQEFVVEYDTRLVELIHSYPDKYVIVHSHGRVSGFLERFAAIVAIATSADTVRSVLGEKAASDFVKEDFGEGAKVLHDLVPRTVKEAEELARAYLKKSEYTLIEATGSCVGDPELKAKALIEIAGVGQRYSGAYYVARVTHTIDDGGYVCELACQRNAVS